MVEGDGGQLTELRREGFARGGLKVAHRPVAQFCWISPMSVTSARGGVA